MPTVIAVSNQKGGVGKTTCTRELGLYIASLGHSVCLIDADPQANLTKSLTDSLNLGLYEALSGKPWEFTFVHDLSLLAGSISCSTIEKNLVGELDAYVRMKELLSEARFSSFEYILIDCPPSLGVLTVNALVASRYLIIPMTPSQYSMQGTNDLLVTLTKVQKTLNPNLSMLGVIINAFEKNPVISREIAAEIEGTLGSLVFSSRISKAIALEEVIARKERVIDRAGKSAFEIRSVGDELISRIAQEAYNG